MKAPPIGTLVRCPFLPDAPYLLVVDYEFRALRKPLTLIAEGDGFRVWSQPHKAVRVVLEAPGWCGVSDMEGLQIVAYPTA